MSNSCLEALKFPPEYFEIDGPVLSKDSFATRLDLENLPTALFGVSLLLPSLLEFLDALLFALLGALATGFPSLGVLNLLSEFSSFEVLDVDR